MLTYDSNESQHTLNLVTDVLTLGKIYSFRLRALNVIGWSDYSPVLLNVGFISLPIKPNAPTRIEL